MSFREESLYLSTRDRRSSVDKYSYSSRKLIKQIFHLNNTNNNFIAIPFTRRGQGENPLTKKTAELDGQNRSATLRWTVACLLHEARAWLVTLVKLSDTRGVPTHTRAMQDSTVCYGFGVVLHHNVNKGGKLTLKLRLAPMKYQGIVSSKSFRESMKTKNYRVLS